MMRKSLFLVFVVSLVCAGGADAQAARLVEYGWDVPDTAYVRAHVAEMERQPFDGLVIKVTDARRPVKDTSGCLGWRVFSRERFAPDQYQHAIDDLRATRFRRMKANFIQIISNPGSVDWFDPEWEAVNHNVRCLARVAKQGRCIGVMFDPEQYGHSLWTYQGLPEAKRREKSFAEYSAMARQRGREFVQAVNAEFPDAVILTLFGPSLPVTSAKRAEKPEEGAYSLLLPFYEGVCDAATRKTRLVDGYEYSYGYRSESAFEQARRVVLEEAPQASAAPEALKRHLRAGFGLWMDYGSNRRPWDKRDFSNNYFAPRELAESVRYALKHADKEGFVWIYTERTGWWNGYAAPPEYVRAMQLARDPRADLSVLPGREHPLPEQASTVQQYRYDEAKTFGDLLATHQVAAPLPERWKFRTDPKRVGEKERWFAPDHDEAGWAELRIDQWWEPQGHIYDGVAWYRARVDVPAGAAGRKLLLVFGAVDESAWVWVNGEKAGEHDRGEAGWDERFSLDVTRLIRPGEANVIAVRVLDRALYGGIWRSAKLLSPKSGSPTQGP